jgi:hypothetical protein
MSAWRGSDRADEPESQKSSAHGHVKDRRVECFAGMAKQLKTIHQSEMFEISHPVFLSYFHRENSIELKA